MPPKNCANDVTHAHAPTRTGARPPAKRITRTGAQPPPRARVGSLVEVEIVEGQPRMGVVVDVAGPKWGTPWYEILFNDGERSIIRTPAVRIVNRRRRQEGKRKKPTKKAGRKAG